MLEFLNSVIQRIYEVFAPQTLGLRAATFLADLLVALLTFAVFYLFWRLSQRAVFSFITRTRLDETAARFLQTVVKYVILSIGLVTALAAIGIDTASVIAGLGIAGLTIGFAARDALSNIISGLFIFWDRPFVINDLVEVDGHYGRVEDITLRSTRVVTVDGKMLAIPNSIMVNTTVASYTNFPHLRLDVEVTVGVTESLGHVRMLLTNLVEGNPKFMSDPPPQVVVTALNDYNVALEVRVWLANEREHTSERLALREAIYDTLNAAGVDMPFETIKLTPIEVQPVSVRQAD